MGSLKRPIDQGSIPVAKRLRRVEQQVKANRPEMKNKLFKSVFGTAIEAAGNLGGNIYSINLTEIANGAGDEERIGNKIKVWRVEVRGIVGIETDVLLLQGHGAYTPAFSEIGDNSLLCGSMISPQSLNSKFTEWAFTRPDPYADDGNPFRIIRKFKGMEVSYEGGISNTARRNNLWLTAVNHSTSEKFLNCSIRVWYTDS